jgi:hypothetical protein
MRSRFLMTRLSKTPAQAVLAGGTSKNTERGRLRGSHERLRALLLHGFRGVGELSFVGELVPQPDSYDAPSHSTCAH